MLYVLDVPADLRPSFPHPYPGHQTGPMIEEFVHHYLLEHADEIELDQSWTYVPVYWTSYAVRRPPVRRWKQRLWGHPSDNRLLSFLRKNLKPGVRYFTVSQHDDGLSQKGTIVPPRPILEFSCGGVGDIPLPLLCDPHPKIDPPRDIRASFLGLLRDTPIPYPCREAMVKALAGRSEYLVEHIDGHWGSTDRQLLAGRSRRYVEIMSRSVFTLCPRGYGKTSYRMYEAMQLGSIPVYIYDKPWLPYTDQLDWNELAVLVPLNKAPALHDILSGISDSRIAAMRARIAELQQEYFTFPGAARQMLRYLRRQAALAA